MASIDNTIRGAVLFVGICISQGAWSALVGGGGGASFQTSHPFTPTGWTIGDPVDRIEVSADPSAGPWIKTLADPAAGGRSVPTSTVFTVHEYLVVGPGPAWIDWHEEILTPGWEWTFGDIIDPTGASTPGLTVSFGSNPPGIPPNVIWFDFDPLLPGTPIEIWKEIHCIDPNGCSGPIQVAEFPTVPLPAAVWLFGSGLLGLVGMARRKRSV